MGKKKIYEKDWMYDILKPAVDCVIYHSYRKIEVYGEDNLPTDGPFILAPNHCNTLMDALVMLRANRCETVFGARADMFRNPLIAKAMFFFRILPMVRQRDGLRNVLKNAETQDLIVETLENDVRFCIYPEGRHRPAKSLLPLGKGVFRAALAANAKFGNTKPIYIVPVGLEYGDFFRYRSTSLATYGKPINVTEFVKGVETENEAQIIDALRKELTARMSGLFTYIKDDERLNEKWVLTKMLSIASGKQGKTLHDRMLENRKFVERIEKAVEEHAEEMHELLEEVKEFDRYRRKDGISIYSFRKTNCLNLILKGFGALIGLPYFIFSAAASLPMWVTEKVLRCKIKDRAFRNTASFGVKLAMGPLWLGALIITAFCTLSWPMALIGSILAIPSFSYFHDYIEYVRIFVSDIRLLNCKKLRKRFMQTLDRFEVL